MKMPFLLFLFSFSVVYSQIDEEERIRKNISAFSNAVVAKDLQAIVNAYTIDAAIFPNGFNILKGTNNIQSYWTPKPGSTTTAHKVYPVEIVIQGDIAYDHGYYEISGINNGTPFQRVRGKYVIVWKKVNGEWKIYLDIWNRAPPQ